MSWPHRPLMAAEREQRRQGQANLRVVGECVYCGGPATTWDHVAPRPHGRFGVGWGYCGCERVPACKRCNASKGRRTPEEWLAAGLYAH